MLNAGKRNVIGVLIDAIDYDATVKFVFSSALEKRPATVSAVAVHGLMTGVLDPEQKFRLNSFDLLVPDGQPVRWAINLMYGVALSDRVYGPNLTQKVCVRAAKEGIPVYFYGSTQCVLEALRQRLKSKFPGLVIAGMEPSKFRRLKAEEKAQLAQRIRASGAGITFVGLGCPRQEVFAFEIRDLLCMPILCVGAAFPFLAGKLPQAPSWMQAMGFEWLFRLLSEPSRLWRRYLYLNPAYLFLVALQVLKLFEFSTLGQGPNDELLYG